MHNRIDPETAHSAEEIRHFDERIFVSPLILDKIVAEERATGQGIGFGYFCSDLESFDPRAFWVEALVDPAHQGRGLGLALATDILARANQRHARRLWAGVRTVDSRAVRFLNRQGFSERHRTWRSRLEISSATILPDRTEELSRQGFSFSTLEREGAANPDVLRELYDLTVVTSADEPRIGPYTPVTFEQFLERDLRGPCFLPDAFFLAKREGRFVALSVLWRADGEPGTLRQAFTGSRREVRGYGLATELKRRTVEYARIHGFQRIRTGNDSRNLPMLAINRKLGFQPEVQRIIAEKILTD